MKDKQPLKQYCFNFGVEFETEYNRDILEDVEIGNYHDGTDFCEYWKCEEDGSLRIYDFRNGNTFELVSNVLELDEWTTAVKTLRKATNPSFSDVFSPNRSCGHHIHFSVKELEKRKIKEVVFLDIFKRIRMLFFQRLRVKYPQHFESIRKHYFRKYAKKMSLLGESNPYMTRYCEFNLSTNESQGLEWRSFNVLGVKKWDDYEGIVRLGLESIKDVITAYLNGKIKIRERISFDLTGLNVEELPKSINYIDCIMIQKEDNELIRGNDILLDFRAEKEVFDCSVITTKQINVILEGN